MAAHSSSVAVVTAVASEEKGKGLRAGGAARASDDEGCSSAGELEHGEKRGSGNGGGPSARLASKAVYVPPEISLAPGVRDTLTRVRNDSMDGVSVAPWLDKATIVETILNVYATGASKYLVYEGFPDFMRSFSSMQYGWFIMLKTDSLRLPASSSVDRPIFWKKSGDVTVTPMPRNVKVLTETIAGKVDKRASTLFSGRISWLIHRDDVHTATGIYIVQLGFSKRNTPSILQAARVGEPSSHPAIVSERVRARMEKQAQSGAAGAAAYASVDAAAAYLGVEACNVNAVHVAMGLPPPVASSDAAQSVHVKRGRGRPRKDGTVRMVEALPSAVPPAANATHETSALKAQPPRGRGRPRGRPPSSLATLVRADDDLGLRAAEEDDDDSSFEDVPRRGHGRRRAALDAEAINAELYRIVMQPRPQSYNAVHEGDVSYPVASGDVDADCEEQLTAQDDDMSAEGMEADYRDAIAALAQLASHASGTSSRDDERMEHPGKRGRGRGRGGRPRRPVPVRTSARLQTSAAAVGIARLVAHDAADERDSIESDDSEDVTPASRARQRHSIRALEVSSEKQARMSSSRMSALALAVAASDEQADTARLAVSTLGPHMQPHQGTAAEDSHALTGGGCGGSALGKRGTDTRIGEPPRPVSTRKARVQVLASSDLLSEHTHTFAVALSASKSAGAATPACKPAPSPAITLTNGSSKHTSISMPVIPLSDGMLLLGRMSSQSQASDTSLASSGDSVRASSAAIVSATSQVKHMKRQAAAQAPAIVSPAPVRLPVMTMDAAAFAASQDSQGSATSVAAPLSHEERRTHASATRSRALQSLSPGHVEHAPSLPGAAAPGRTSSFTLSPPPAVTMGAHVPLELGSQGSASHSLAPWPQRGSSFDAYRVNMSLASTSQDAAAAV